MKLYLYSNLAGKLGWFATPKDYRKAFPNEPHVWRCHHGGHKAPLGFHKPSGTRAFDAVEPIK